ncbi:SDR family oxidoreductase [Saccharothrix obliqua]|uniref:SDR family oxidoreductase n=1 Tax=Saccharothrix obliqua TaxID=2861747 RepID=UPI001C5F7399|nr:NAD(P)H-binding protein [Saccharothrix obliqua]MBW4716150.1 NAD(P)H-binding protein [Saccharothrix obliqua]
MTILVTGATGNVGGHVVRQLVTAGVDFRALTRNPDKADLPAGVVTVKGDLTRPAELPLAGVTAVFLNPVVVAPDVAALAEDFLRHATDLRRVVLLSSDAVAVRRPGSYEALETVEKVVEASGLEWTHVRPGEFMSNKLIWADTIRKENVVRFAYPDAVGAPVHEADIAEVAVRALLEDGHHGRAYRLSGPEALTHRQQAAAIGAGLGRAIGFEQVTYGQARAALIRDVGVPWDAAEYLMGYAAQHNEEPPSVQPTFQEVVGRRGRTLAEWAADHAAELG